MPLSAMPETQWHASAPTAPDCPPLEGPASVDVAVVGAGVTGLSCALHAAEAGLSVAVLEAGEPGFGGSGRNNGQVIPTLAKPDPSHLRAKWGDAGDRFARMIGGSAEQLFALVRRFQISCEAMQTGWIQPAHRPSRLAVSERRQREWSALALDCRVLDAEETAGMLGTQYWHGGLFCPTGGHINPLAFTRGLARAAQQMGATVHAASPVTGITRQTEGGSGGWQLATRYGTVRADTVVLATNAYTAKLWPALARSIVPVRNYQMATAPLPPDVAETILPADLACSDTHGDLYFFRKTRDNRLVSGCTLASRDDDPVQAQARVRARLAEVFPQLRPQTPAIARCWSGELGFTPDFHPRFYTLAPGLLTAIGYNGRGMALGVAVGEQLARAASGIPFKDLALPDGGRPRSLPLHGLVTRLAPLMMHWWRHKDRRD